MVKTLNNNTELTNVLNRHAHDISYSVLSVMNTENAYNLHDMQINIDVVIPIGRKSKDFTIYVCDNIDRREETLSGNYEFSTPL